MENHVLKPNLYPNISILNHFTFEIVTSNFLKCHVIISPLGQKILSIVLFFKSSHSFYFHWDVSFLAAVMLGVSGRVFDTRMTFPPIFEFLLQIPYGFVFFENRGYLLEDRHNDSCSEIDVRSLKLKRLARNKKTE